MRSILLHVADDEGFEPRLQVALALARTFDGHVTCLQATAYDNAVPGDMYGMMAAQLVNDMRVAADALRETIEPRLAGEDVAWSWEQLNGLAADRLIDASCLSDLVVIGCREPIGTAPSTLPGELAVRARTPILVVPADCDGFDTAAPALVAWDGSAESCRALRAAVPLLARAEAVILASVFEKGEESFDLPATDGAEYLSRHGIASEIVELPAGDGSISGVLGAAALARGAGYMVAGAYGHMRFTEMIWGGVTRELFADPPLPIFACH